MIIRQLSTAIKGQAICGTLQSQPNSLEDCRKGKITKMKLYLAAAVLMLVLAVHTEAQDEPTLEQQFAKFQTKVMELTEDLTQKTKTTFEELEKNELVIKTRNWLTEQFEAMKDKIAASII
ncbi:apolipoprotein C-I [Carassius gibelio]|uniref:apolipoprotein C-I n=1 Tax=Carassius gibelio TaxID=101364 RepID=UPI0022783E30|nr:apolipoprotein C-I [Carassius gibelio]